MKKILFLVLCLIASYSYAQNMTGAWKGDIQIQGNRLPIVFHLQQNGDSLSGTWDSPAQKAFKLSFSTLRIKGDSLIATIQNLQAEYSGKFVAVDSLSGTWKQGAVSFPLSMKRHDEEDAPEKLKDEKEIIIPVAKNISISGTLISRSTTEPLVIIIAGSGPTDRDGNNPLGVSSDSYRLLAQELYDNHISTYRYDKRGIAKSSAGNMTEAAMRFTDFSNDADSIVAYFRTQGYQKIFIAGHSEGSLLGMLVAEQMNLTGYISISGAGIPADQILEQQMTGKVPGVSDSTIRRVLSEIKDGKAVNDIPEVLKPIFRPSVQPYLTSWLKYDPRMEIQRISCPILIIQGTCDVQVGVQNATDLFNAAKHATIKIIPGMSHTLKDAGKDCVNQQQTYTDPSLPVSKELVSDIVTFVKQSAERNN